MSTKAKAIVRSDGTAVDGARLARSSQEPVRRLALLALAAAAAAFLALTAASAFAVNTHVFSTSFGTSGSGDGQVSNPQGVAVNSTTHDVYVADTNNARVDQFSSAGTFIRAFGADVGGSGVNVCTTGCVAATPGTGPGAFTTPTFIAVDNDSSSASVGDVYVGDTTNNVVTKFDASGSLITTWGSGGQLDGSTATDGPFGALAGTAVDGSGNLWVYDQNGEMFEFAQDGSFSQDWNSGRGVTAGGIATDSAGNLYVATGAVGVTQFTSAGTQVGDIDDTYSNITGIGVDSASGDLYVDDGGSIRRYDSSCDPSVGCTATDTFGSDNLVSPAGLAIDSSTHNLYVGDSGNNRVAVFVPAILPDVSTGVATHVLNTSATLNGTVNPDGTTITDCHFEYVTDAAFQSTGYTDLSSGGSAPCSTTPTGSSTTPVHTDVTGLSASTTYHFRLLAANSGGSNTGADQTFDTPSPPVVSGQTVSSVGISTATVSALINPEAADTTYHVEYGTAGPCSANSCASYPVLDTDIGSGSTDVPATVSLPGLQPGTTYSYRFVASNSVDTSAGPDGTFTTFTQPSSAAPCANDQFRTGAGARLPDCRAYEQASPTDKNGNSVLPFEVSNRASPSGNGFTFPVIGGIPGGTGEQALPTYLARRNSGAWSTQALDPPASYGYIASVAGWSEDLSEVFDVAAQSASATTTDFLLDDTSDHSLQTIQSAGVDTFHLVGTSSDGSTVFFEAKGPALTPDAAAGRNNLYAWVRASGSLSLVGVLPGGTTPPDGSYAGPWDWVNPSVDLSISRDEDFTYMEHNAISDDGSHVFFSAGTPPQLYLRQDPTAPGATTTLISASQKTNGSGPGGTDANGPQPAAFMSATPDGSKVLFTSPEELTNDATTGSADQGNDLYAYDVVAGQLTDLTPDLSDANGAEVQGVIGESNDGSSVYFVANGVLASGASPGDCDGSIATGIAANGSCNVYLWHDGQLTFIARLNADGDGGGARNWRPFPGSNVLNQTSRVSADGQTLLFTTDRQLTAYDNTGPCAGTPHGSSPGPCLEVYRYAPGDSSPTCVSCDPTGAAPQDDAAFHLPFSLVIGGPPAPTASLTRNLSADGQRAFFDSADPLAPQDTNGVVDPYEWEAAGAGSCTPAAAAYSAQAGGCLYLLTAGTSPYPSFFGDASANGDDSFVLTDTALVAQDGDQLADVYDARVGGGLASQHQTPAAPCTGDNCKPPPSGSPPDQAPGSGQAGPGNQGKNLGGSTASPKKKCKKHGKHKKCKKSRRSSSNRGGAK